MVSTRFFPAYVVWELTLRCDLACRHCGSRAGRPRAREWTTDEALATVDELARLGAREVVLIGGEAYLHPGFFQVVAALAKAGITPALTTGGRALDAEMARRMADAGLAKVGVSVDGLEATHDRMRGLQGSFAAATRALDHAREAGLVTTANTNLNRLNRDDLEGLYEHLRGRIRAWQIQITTPLGRAADRPEMILQPWDLLDLVPRIAALKQRAFADGVQIAPGNNLGYFGPEEAALRSPTPDGRDHFRGCQAGRFVLGLESDGAVKGCPSLQTSAYVGGNAREQSIAEIWATSDRLAFTRERGVDDLWGYCRSCPFAEVCLGGCSFTAHAVFGRPGNNPYCHFRAREFARRGLRERLVPTAAAQGRPFDHGLFEVAVEDLDAPDPKVEPERLVQITRPRTV